MKNLLVLLRHGESKWNLENRFTGWTDVSLTQRGINEAKNAGKLLKKELFDFDIVYCSFLERAIHTMEICLKEMKLDNVNTEKHWQLNERHYGALQGLNKIETAKEFGEDKVFKWRRSYDIPPPYLSLDDKRHPKFDKKYNNLSELPVGESLKDTYDRVIPFWNKIIREKILLGKKILIVAHGNSIRALIKFLDNISNKEIIKLNIPTGIPLVYKLSKDLKPIKHFYLGNQNEIDQRVNNVIKQGKI